MVIQERLVPEHPARDGKPTCIVLHTTGTSQLEKALRYYQTSSQGICPHYVVGGDGTVFQTLPDDQIAYHCGHGDIAAKLYEKGWTTWSRWAGKPLVDCGESFSGYLWWPERWPGKDSPLDLVTGKRPNRCSIGIEFQASHRTLPEVFTDEQYAAGAELVADLIKKHGIPLDLDHVLDHSSVNPIARCNAKGPVDLPRSFNWGRMLAAAKGLI